MKTSIFALIFSLAASALAADETFYLVDRNATCTGHADGSITCENGQIDGAPVIETPEGYTTPAIRGREADALQKRVTCQIPLLGGASCAIHCGLLGYCNQYCDDGICKCRCLDKSGPKGGLPCARTTCS